MRSVRSCPWNLIRSRRYNAATPVRDAGRSLTTMRPDVRNAGTRRKCARCRRTMRVCFLFSREITRLARNLVRTRGLAISDRLDTYASLPRPDRSLSSSFSLPHRVTPIASSVSIPILLSRFLKFRAKRDWERREAAGARHRGDLGGDETRRHRERNREERDVPRCTYARFLFRDIRNRPSLASTKRALRRLRPTKTPEDVFPSSLSFSPPPHLSLSLSLSLSLFCSPADGLKRLVKLLACISPVGPVGCSPLPGGL